MPRRLPLQVSLKDTIAVQRSLESKLSTCQTSDSSRDFKIREAEGRLRALEKENEMLRQKVALNCTDSNDVCGVVCRVWIFTRAERHLRWH